VLGNLLAPEIQEMIKAGDFSALRTALEDLPPGDLADALSDLPAENSAVVFRIMPRGLATETFGYLPVALQEGLLKALGEHVTADILNAMSPDDRTQLLEELPAEATKRLMALLSPDEMATARKLLGYPEQSVGRFMTPNYISVHEKWTIGQALGHIRANGRRSENLTTIYVTDPAGHLTGMAPVGEMLLAPDDSPVTTVANRNFHALSATDNEKVAVTAFRRHLSEALPVTDSQGVLVGIVTADDVLLLSEREATQDIQMIGGTEAFDEPYLRISIARMVRKRAGWLVVLFVGEMLTATAMGYFEAEIARAVVLALFVPLIISSGGNSGSQASTLVIRAMALGEVGLRDWWRVMRREVISGLALGSILGGIGFLRITLWSAFSSLYGPHWMLVAIAVSLALLGVVLWGTLAGSMLPFVLRRAGFDPAASSAPFVATLVDVTGLVIYFSVAAAVLHGTLL
jgi:magnesium transporter